MIHCCEAPRSMLSNNFCKKQVLFEEIWRIQIQIYSKTDVELKYGGCNLKNEVSTHRLGLVVQLSKIVAPPFKILQHLEFPKAVKNSLVFNRLRYLILLGLGAAVKASEEESYSMTE